MDEVNLVSDGPAVDMCVMCLLENEDIRDQTLVHMNVCSN